MNPVTPKETKKEECSASKSRTGGLHKGQEDQERELDRGRSGT